jgi:hypothetical protein
MVREPLTATVARLLPIEPDFDWDYTQQWGDRVSPTLSVVAYQRYAPPKSRAQCVEQIEGLTATIASCAESIEGRRQEALLLADQGLDCGEVQTGLRRANDAMRKYKAARSIYLHWLKLEDGAVEEPQPVVTQPPTALSQRVVALASAVRLLAETYRADLAESIEVRDAEQALGEVFALLETAEG